MDINSSYLQNFALMNDGALAQNTHRSKQKQLEAAQDFEAVFIQSSLKAMRPKMEGGLFNDGLAVDVFYQFMDDAIAKDISRSKNNFGIADALMKQNF